MTPDPAHLRQLGDRLEELGAGWEDAARLVREAAGVLAGLPAGIPIGRNDRHGRPICIGDTLRFDEREWGGPCVFRVELWDGEIRHPGSSADLSEWCEIVSPATQEPRP